MDQAVKYAINTMEMEGFTFTEEEKKMWKAIGEGKLPLSAADDYAKKLERIFREKFPEKFTGDE